MLSKSAFAVAAVLGDSFVRAHQIMVDPVPYNYESWDNSPILADGSNFPCKITGDYTVTKENTMEKGETQYLTFHGGATHGGGSCQISITPDRAPTKDTTWSVILSIEGGCMDEDEGDENIGNTAAMVNPFSPNFTIPDSIEPGKYTLAWTWFNRIGNREMYMNCAPITITGSSSKRSEIVDLANRNTEFPPLFIANINGCQLRQNKDVRFPKPGDNLEYLNTANLIGESENVCYSGSPTWGTAGYGSSGDSVPEPTASTTATTSASALSTSDSLTSTVPDNTPELTQPSESTTTSTPTTTAIETAAPVATSSAVPKPSGSISGSGDLSGSCTTEGEWNCIGGSSFQRCASGSWSEVQQMASGTVCTPGLSVDFTIKATSLKSRMVRERRSRKRAHSGHIHA